MSSPVVAAVGQGVGPLPGPGAGYAAAARPLVGVGLASLVVCKGAWDVWSTTSLTAKGILLPLEHLRACAPDRRAGMQSAAGAAAEGVKALAVYPLDFARGRLSGAPGLYPGLSACIRETVRTEGFAGLYKGLSACLLTNTGRGAMQFAIYGAAQRHYQDLWGLPADAAVPAAVSLAAGATSGALTSLAECPLEVVMTQLQIQDAHAAATRLAAKREVVGCAVTQFSADLRAQYASQIRYGHGGFTETLLAVHRNRAWFLGLGPLMVRNAGFYASIWFAFEQLKSSAALITLGDSSRDAQSRLPLSWRLACGAASGCFAWAVVFPFEALKVNTQGQPLQLRFRTFSSTLHCARRLSMEGGVRRFYIGLLPTLLRALPANAVVMGMSDLMRAALGAY